MLALSLYLLARLRLCLEELPKKRIEFLFLHLHVAMLTYWRVRRDSDPRDAYTSTRIINPAQ